MFTGLRSALEHSHAKIEKDLPQNVFTKKPWYAKALTFPFTGGAEPTHCNTASYNYPFLSWHNSVRQVVFSWQSPNPQSSIRLPTPLHPKLGIALGNVRLAVSFCAEINASERIELFSFGISRALTTYIDD